MRSIDSKKITSLIFACVCTIKSVLILIYYSIVFLIFAFILKLNPQRKAENKGGEQHATKIRGHNQTTDIAVMHLNHQSTRRPLFLKIQFYPHFSVWGPSKHMVHILQSKVRNKSRHFKNSNVLSIH